MQLSGNVIYQKLIDARYELDRLAFDGTKTAQEIAAFLSAHAETVTPQQAPALLLLQRKVEQMKGGEQLAAKLKKIIELLPPSSDPDDLFLTGVTKMVCNPQYSADKIRQFLQNAKTTLPQIKERWDSQAPEEVLKPVLCERTSQCVARASLPFFQACAANQVNPFSMMCAKKEVALAPTNGYSIAHAAALETDSALLQQLFEKNPAHFEQKTPLGGTVWDLLRARGHALPPDRPITYPFGIPRRYLSQSILMPEICQEFMKLTPNPIHPIFQAAVQKYQERKKRGEQDPVDIFQLEQGPMKGQCGARASRKVAAGELFLAYRGKITSFKANSYKQHDDSYNQKFDHFHPLYVQAVTAGSMGEMINHGPPNCVAVEFEEDGIPCLVFFAVREIAQGEELFQTYGPNFFIGRHFVEMAPKRIDDYLQETNNLSMISPFMEETDGNMIDIKINGNLVKFSKTVAESKTALFHRMLYHRLMLSYICLFPHRTFERLGQSDGHILAQNWVSLLDVCEKKNLLEFLRITPEGSAFLQDTIQNVFK